MAYRVNEHFSVGAGVSAQYIDVTLSRAVFTGPSSPDGFAEVTADNWGYGFNLGATYEFDPNTRIGLSYRYGIDHTLEGELNVRNVPGRSGTAPGSADLRLPDTIGLGFYKRFNEQWAVMAGARWTQWSRFDELRITFANGRPDEVTQENWNDSWAFSIGASYDYHPNWTFRVGYAYDQTPIPGPEYRTPRIPSNSRQWLSVGASYRPIKNLGVDVGYAHLFFEDSSLINTITVAETPGLVVTDTLQGDYNGSSADIVGVQFSWSF